VKKDTPTFNTHQMDILEKCRVEPAILSQELGCIIDKVIG